jgi:hypothetical protein
MTGLRTGKARATTKYRDPFPSLRSRVKDGGEEQTTAETDEELTTANNC